MHDTCDNSLTDSDRLLGPGGLNAPGCDGNDAEVHVTIHINDSVRTEARLCEDCADRIRKNAKADGYRVETEPLPDWD